MIYSVGFKYSTGDTTGPCSLNVNFKYAVPLSRAFHLWLIDDIYVDSYALLGTKIELENTRHPDYNQTFFCVKESDNWNDFPKIVSKINNTEPFDSIKIVLPNIYESAPVSGVLMVSTLPNAF